MSRRRFLLPLALAAALLLPAGAALGAEPTPATLGADEVIYPRNSPAARQHRITEDSFPLWGMLGLVVVLGGAGFYFLRRGHLLRPRGGAAATLQHLSIEETRSLGNKQFLAVAAYGKRKMLLSVCPGRIDLLCRLEEPETAATATPAATRHDLAAE